jgi:hypothetical protein
LSEAPVEGDTLLLFYLVKMTTTLAASNNSLLIKYNTNTYDVDNSGLAMHRHKHVKGLNSQVIT